MSHTQSVTAPTRAPNVGDAAREHVKLVEFATLAASSHNTQPWKFRLEPSRITILPDLSRRCPIVDPDDHHLHASLGCAAENLLWAARAGGHEGHVSYSAAGDELYVDLEPAAPLRSALFDAIPLRQCSRSEYDATALSPEALRLLEQAATGDGVSVLLLTSPTQKAQVAELVASGNRAQFRDARWAEEMKGWLRFNRREALQTGDGLYGPTLGIPEVPRWLGTRVMRVAAPVSAQNRKDAKHIASSAAIAVLFSERDDKRHWAEAGRSYERLALQATALQLCTAFINQPVEVPGLRAQLAGLLGIGQRRPDLVVRLGRGPRMPRSMRRSVSEVLI